MVRDAPSSGPTLRLSDVPLSESSGMERTLAYEGMGTWWWEGMGDVRRGWEV